MTAGRNPVKLDIISLLCAHHMQKDVVKRFHSLFDETVEGAALIGLRSYEISQNPQRMAQVFSAKLVWRLLCAHRYAIIFRKSTAVTNLQYAELYSLLHESVIAPTRNETIIFHSSRELRNDLEALWLSQVCITDEFQKYCEAKDRELAEKEIEDRKKEAVQKILNIYNAAYREQCYRTVLIEPFFTSCCIAMPAHLSLNLTHIVGQAGYIFSRRACLLQKFFKGHAQGVSWRVARRPRCDYRKLFRRIETCPICSCQILRLQP